MTLISIQCSHNYVNLLLPIRSGHRRLLLQAHYEWLMYFLLSSHVVTNAGSRSYVVSFSGCKTAGRQLISFYQHLIIRLSLKAVYEIGFKGLSHLPSNWSGNDELSCKQPWVSLEIGDPLQLYLTWLLPSRIRSGAILNDRRRDTFWFKLQKKMCLLHTL